MKDWGLKCERLGIEVRKARGLVLKGWGFGAEGFGGKWMGDWG